MRKHPQQQKRHRKLFFESLEDRRLLAPVAWDDNYTIPEDNFPYLSVSAPGVLANNTATVGITVQPVNEPPDVEGDFYNVAPNSTVSIPSVNGVLRNDSDVEWDALAVELESTTAFGALVLNGDGSFTYTPLLGFVGIDSFTYRASDGSSFSATATVILNISFPAVFVVAVDDGYSIAEDGTLAVNAPGVLINDGSNIGNPLTAEVVSGPAHGVLSFGPDGGFTYFPFPNFSGFDSFLYLATDGPFSDTATVIIEVLPVNDAPDFLRGPDLNVTDEDPMQRVAGWAGEFSAGAANETRQKVTVNVSNDHQELFKDQPAIDASGTLTFAPRPNAEGTATVTVRLSDDGGTANAGQDVSEQTFTIAVKKPRVSHNSVLAADASGDGTISLIDAVLVMNFVRSNGFGPAPTIRLPGQPFYDVSGDGLMSILDIVLVLNHFNLPAAGEAVSESTGLSYASGINPEARNTQGEETFEMSEADAGWLTKPKRRR